MNLSTQEFLKFASSHLFISFLSHDNLRTDFRSLPIFKELMLVITLIDRILRHLQLEYSDI